jgi:hypothetical protein
VFGVYDPPEEEMPFLTVRTDGVKIKSKKVQAIAAKTCADAEKHVAELERDLMDPHWRDRERLHAAYDGSAGKAYLTRYLGRCCSRLQSNSRRGPSR